MGVAEPRNIKVSVDCIDVNLAMAKGKKMALAVRHVRSSIYV